MSVSFWTNAGVLRQLERRHAMRLQTVRVPDALDGGAAHAGVSCTMACTWSAVISGLRPRPGRTAPTESKPSVRNRARQSNTVGRLMPSCGRDATVGNAVTGHQQCLGLGHHAVRRCRTARPHLQRAPVFGVERQRCGGVVHAHPHTTQGAANRQAVLGTHH